MYPCKRNKAEVNESLILEYHSPERIKYEKETIPHMQELSRFDLKMTSDLKLGLEQVNLEKKSRYRKIDKLKVEKLKTEIEENNKEVELELEADGYQGLKALYDRDLL